MHRSSNFETVEDKQPIHPVHLPLSYGGACDKIVEMLGSVLVIVDTLLATAATTEEDQQQSCDQRFVLSSLPRNNAELPSNHNPRPRSNALTYSAPIRTTFHNHPPTGRDRDNPKGNLTSLLNQRKPLNREATDSESNNDEEMQLELANARRKRD